MLPPCPWEDLVIKPPQFGRVKPQRIKFSHGRSQQAGLHASMKGHDHVEPPPILLPKTQGVIGPQNSEPRPS
jgi:hypothetical protein